MFLAGSEIQERLSRGDLIIDPPPSEGEIDQFSIDLRLGTQFLRFPPKDHVAPLDPAAFPESLSSLYESASREMVPLGESLVLPAGAALLAVTLEYIHMPSDLAAFFFPKSLWERVGLSVAPGTIDPGFRGKIALALRSANTVPVLLSPGLRIARLCLAPLAGAASYEAHADTLGSSREIASLKETLEEAVPRRSPEALSAEALATRFSEVLTTEGPRKGQALEQLVADLFTGLDGLRILRRDARLSAEELDLVITNDLDTGFWRVAGSPLVVECKNWSSKVGAREISVLVDKLQALSPDAKGGVLVAFNGVTGDSKSDAKLKIREARQRGRYVLVLERRDLEEVVRGVSLADMIERKYNELVLI